jgi:hypothetical protein
VHALGRPPWSADLGRLAALTRAEMSLEALERRLCAHAAAFATGRTGAALVVAAILNVGAQAGERLPEYDVGVARVGNLEPIDLDILERRELL